MIRKFGVKSNFFEFYASAEQLSTCLLVCLFVRPRQKTTNDQNLLNQYRPSTAPQLESS